LWCFFMLNFSLAPSIVPLINSNSNLLQFTIIIDLCFCSKEGALLKEPRWKYDIEWNSFKRRKTYFVTKKRWYSKRDWTDFFIYISVFTEFWLVIEGSCGSMTWSFGFHFSILGKTTEIKYDGLMGASCGLMSWHLFWPLNYS
jgi:hypothetical protein